MMELHKKGVITGKIHCAFTLGTKELVQYSTNEQIQFYPLSIVNNPVNIGKNKKMISINACMMVDLTGQVCSESIGHYHYSSTGGQLDYVFGSWLSEGGKSILCLPSTNEMKDGSVVSTITLNLPEGAVITTPRSLTMNIVTEYGVARLKNRSIRDRVNAMISIAHPDFRDSLRREAIEAGLIPT